MRRALAFGGEAGVNLSSDDAATLAWVQEFFGPSLSPATSAEAAPEVGLESSAEAYAELRGGQPPDPAPRPCFAFDQSMMSLPSWEADGRLLAADDDRSCMIAVSPSGADLTGDPGSRRWRHTLVWLIQEQIATRLRRSQLELHAATVETGGRSIALVGPKRSGKTTLSFHLLRSRLVRVLANDRAFVGATADGIVVRGVPSAVRIRPDTQDEFPELGSGLASVERPFLHSLEELAEATPGRPPEPGAMVLSPEQIASRLGVERTDRAPVGSLVFPQIDPDAEGWRVEPISVEAASTGIWANLFGDAARERPPTIFEELDGGRSAPARRLADLVAESAAGYRVVLGRGAYDDPEFAARFLESVAPVR